MSTGSQQEFPPAEWLQAGVQETQFAMALGGPNSGKTQRVVDRVAFLLEQGESPRRISCLTVRDESAGHLRRRLRSHPGVRDHLEPLFAGTFTQCANMFLRRAGHGVLGIRPDYGVWSEADAVAVLKLALPTGLGYKVKPQVIRDALHWHWRTQERWPVEQAEHPREPLWLDIAEIYTGEKGRATTLDGRDLIVLALRALEDDADLRTIWAIARFKHVILEQAEEATGRQLALLRQMVGPSSFLMVTGDPDQAVHGDATPVALEYLQQAYRPHVYRLGNSRGGNAGLARLAAALERDLGIPGAPDDAPGPGRPTGESPRLVTVEGHFLDLYSDCLQEAQALHCQGVAWEDMAVLYRRGRAVERMRVQLAHGDIPFRVLGEPPPDRPTDARWLAALLASALTSRDPLAVRLAAVPGYPNKRRILPDGISLKLREVAQQQGLDLIGAAASLLQSDELGGRGWGPLVWLVNCLSLVDRYLEGASGSLADLCQDLTKHIGAYRVRGLPDPDAEPEDQPDDLDITDLLDLCRSTPQLPIDDRRAHLRRVLDLWSPALHPARRYESQAGITFSSIHAAKGRVWPVVFVLDCSDQAIPGRVGPYSGRLELEQRLLLIAVTRATRSLHLYCLADTGMAGARYTPSRFLDCARELLEHHHVPYRAPESGPDPFADPW